ncbi:hypothetical protein Tco_0409986 [Tanacetum coccineum]
MPYDIYRLLSYAMGLINLSVALVMQLLSAAYLLHLRITSSQTTMISGSSSRILMAFAGQIVNNLTFRYFLEKEKLPDPNFLDWYHNLSIVLTYLEHPIPAAPVPVTPKQQIPVDILAAHTRWVKASKEIACLMLVSMTLDLQKNLEHFVAFDMLLELKTLFS